MSKGRTVADFFPHVVKLVGVPNLEVRKMVYIYLARYANHDNSCRELALLSINAFQRGLADREPLLRSLALRVLTCMDVPDVLQLQILGLRTCCKDSSPYVRKCAANAVGKLHPRCLAAGDGMQADQLVDIITSLLEEDGSTMVLTSAMIAFCEICPQRLELLHGCYRKVCHLLTDMDEWGQVIVMNALMQYCRTYFKQPRGQMKGSAERIDQERRVTRSTRKIILASSSTAAVADTGGSLVNGGDHSTTDTLLSLDAAIAGTASTTAAIANGTTDSEPSALPPHPGKKKVKRRVVRKAFYSDEEDESSEEEVNPYYPVTGGNAAGTLRQQQVLGTPTADGSSKSFGFRDDVNATTTSANGGDDAGNFGWSNNLGAPVAVALEDDDEDDDLHEDHKLLLESSLPLLKSRNSAVVLAACSLQYHCGVASVKTRSAMGKSLVRIHRDRREIQYMVLVSIRTLVKECPSAFSPFLNDFFVKGMDPSFTRTIKLDILVSLCHDPKAIESVLTELRIYVRHSDKAFACAAIRAVGKIAELARVVYDRRAHNDDGMDVDSARAESNVIVLNCLSGLITLSEFSKNAEVVGECAETMQRILSQLWSDDGVTSPVADQAGVQEKALKRLLLILVRSLNTNDDASVNDDDDEEISAEQTRLEKKTVRVPHAAVASIIWIIGEWLTMPKSMISPWNISEEGKSKIRAEVLRLLAKSFTSLDAQIKLQAVHLASKILVMNKADQASLNPKECAMSELIHAMARVDVLQDVRDRARCEGNILHMSVGLDHDTSALEEMPPNTTPVSVDTAKSMLLKRKPNASSLPLDSQEFGSAKNETDLFRFGTLSNVLSSRAMGSTVPLPQWAEKDSSNDLRDPSAGNISELNGEEGGLYSSSSEDESSSSSSDDDSSSSDDSSEEESDDDSSNSDSDSSDDSDEDNDNTGLINMTPTTTAPIQMQEATMPSLINNQVEDASSSDSSDDSSDSDESSGSDEALENVDTNAKVDQTPAVGNILDMDSTDLVPQTPQYNKQTSSSSSVVSGLEGLVMAPLVTSKDDLNKPSSIDDESGAWKDYVKPELSGGLHVKMRFVHGRSRTKEARVLGVDPQNPSTVCLQVHIENK